MTNRPQQHSLLIGRLPDTDAAALPDADRCGNIFEALTTLQQQSYQAIYLVLADVPEPRQDALQALSRVAPQARRYLLIDMFEEPAAIALQHTGNGRLLFNDYFVLPLGDGFGPPQSRPVPPQQVAAPPQATFPDQAYRQSMEHKDRLIHELQTLVTQDDLTGLKNRRYLRQFLPAILENAEQTGCQVTLLLFDLDNFKHYNDTYGHSIGDAVLLQTGKLMRRCCRAHDVVARLGGDEFAVIFWDLPEDMQSSDDRRSEHADHPRQAQFMAERFRSEMAQADFECLGAKGKGSLTISGGLATYPRDAKSAEELYEKADYAMLNAKKTGKNKIKIVGNPT